MKIKNYILTMMKALVLTAMTVGLANCSKDKGSSTTTTTTYRCFQVNTYNGTSAQVDNSYCYNNSYQNGYSTYQCRDVNNAVVTNTLCANTGVANGNGSVVSCHGQTFYWQGIQITCGVTYNCPSGVVLQTLQGQVVQCQ